MIDVTSSGYRPDVVCRVQRWIEVRLSGAEDRTHGAGLEVAIRNTIGMPNFRRSPHGLS